MSAGPPPHATPLGRAATAWVEHLARSGRPANTVDAYRGDLRSYVRVLVALGHVDPARIGPAEVEAFVLAFTAEPGRGGRPRSDATVARVLSAVRGFHAWLAETGRSEDDPAAGVASPQAVRAAPVALEPDQVATLLAPPDGGERSPDLAVVRDHAMVVLLVRTGIRAAELVALDVGDVDDDARGLHVRGARPRPLVLPDPRPLRAWVARRDELPRDVPALFPNLRGGRMTRQGAWRVVTARCARVGLAAGTSPRVLRNTFAATERAAGTPEPQVRELLGTVPWTGGAQGSPDRGDGAERRPEQ